MYRYNREMVARRHVIVAQRESGMTYAAIARIHGVTATTIKTILAQHARKMVRRY